MIRVLIVEDDNQKFGKIKSTVVSAGIIEENIDFATNSVDALAKLRSLRFDLVLLDVNIPRRYDGDPVRGEGIALLKRVDREAGIYRPRYVVGITAFADVVDEFGDDFADQLWSLVHYNEASDRWKSQLTAKIDYICALRRSDNFTDGQTFGVDVALLCALSDPEWAAVRALPCGWQPLRIPHDQTRYLVGSIDTSTRSISIVTAAAPRMGMPASAVLASKLISTFRPRVLGMTGICAGRSSKTNLGDVVIANPAYDWGSGKIDSEHNQPRFRPSPHQLDMNVDLAAYLIEFFDSPATRASIRSESPAAPARGDLKVHVAPMASGAAVVANASLFEELLDKNRDVAGLEMEAYGVLVAASECAKPRPLPIVLKGVCDFADEDKADDYQAFAAHISARCFYEVVKDMYASGRVHQMK